MTSGKRVDSRIKNKLAEFQQSFFVTPERQRLSNTGCIQEDQRSQLLNHHLNCLRRNCLSPRGTHAIRPLLTGNKKLQILFKHTREWNTEASDNSHRWIGRYRPKPRGRRRRRRISTNKELACERCMHLGAEIYAWYLWFIEVPRRALWSLHNINISGD